MIRFTLRRRTGIGHWVTEYLCALDIIDAMRIAALRYGTYRDLHA